VSDTPKASFVCPSCGSDKPHYHFAQEVVWLRSAQKDGSVMGQLLLAKLIDGEMYVLASTAHEAIATAHSTGFRAGIEAAAKVCEDFYSVEGIAQKCAAAIRAIKVPE